MKQPGAAFRLRLSAGHAQQRQQWNTGDPQRSRACRAILCRHAQHTDVKFLRTSKIGHRQGRRAEPQIRR
jgi:hypothetical protein